MQKHAEVSLVWLYIPLERMYILIPRGVEITEKKFFFNFEQRIIVSNTDLYGTSW